MKKSSDYNSRLIITALVIGLPTIAFFLGLIMLANGAVSNFDISIFLVMYMLTMIGVEGGFHRMVSHKAFRSSLLIRNLFVLFGSMASQGPVIFWAATHRKHHVFTDKIGDPHSPLAIASTAEKSTFNSFVHGHCGWLFGEETVDWARYAADLIKDQSLFRMNQLYFHWVILGLFLPFLLGWVYTQSIYGALTALLWGGFIRIFAVHHMVWSVNSICHMHGTQPFNTGGHSKNNIFLALPTLGGAWHNNHHAFPMTASNAFKWWQIDIIGTLLQILARLGLVWDMQITTRQKIINKKHASQKPIL